MAQVEVGKRFLLARGIEVEVMSVNAYTQYKQQKCTVRDDFGNIKENVWFNAVVRGEVKWDFELPPSGIIGEQTTLKTGVVVTVIKEYKDGRVCVTDSEGNTKSTTRRRFYESDIGWAEFAHKATNGSWKIKAGDKTTLNCGVEVTVVAYNNCEDVVIVDNKGNSRSTSSSELKTGSVSWAKFGVKKASSLRKRFVVGSVVTSNKYGDFEILKVDNACAITVRWVIDGYIQENCKSSLIANRSLKHEVLASKEDTLNPVGYYVYVATLNEDILYIGKGKALRYKHVTSGKSNCLELNRLFFLGVTPTVEIHKDNLTDIEAQVLETSLIKSMRPKYNIALNGSH